ncbi:hypothetical protein H4R26_000356 [Coemansia thaxteri]|uniref:Hyaluronan/mRNA-binding protein domain-containing protein n=1 Tax=Coemansia thaxteri TaxID=2663907 RepID=A0A9W8BNS3_9FUNG|nr:hypothetical protein H4R26_000356 [Coemansia thaxteri]
MSVVSTNPFALLPDNAADSVVDVVAGGAKQAAAKQAPKKAVPVAPAADRATPSERASTRSTGYPSRGGRRTVGTTRSAAAAAATDATPAFQPREKDHTRAAHQSTRGRGSARGRGRQFDRHSATGLVDSEKKEKQGWLGDDAAMVQDGAQASADAKKDGQDAPAPAAAVEEPEEVVKTFDDYLKERKPAAEEQRTLRKPNEARVDQTQLKGGAFTVDKKEDVYFAPIATQKSRKTKERKEKVFVDIEQRFDEPRRTGGPAFRGGARGGAASGPQNQFRRGGAAAGGSRPARVNISDERAFPSL